MWRLLLACDFAIAVFTDMPRSGSWLMAILIDPFKTCPGNSANAPMPILADPFKKCPE